MITVYGANTTVEALRKIPVERPEGAGSTWQGIQHGELVDTIVDECKCRGWAVGRMAFALARGNTDLAGAIDVTIPGMATEAGVTTGIGFMTSNARRKALRLFVGGTVHICHNGLTTGTVVVARKHTSEMDLIEEVDRGLDKYLVAAAEIPATIARLKEKPITAAEATGLVTTAGADALCRMRDRFDFLNEFHNPTHAEHGTGTGWSMLNAYTEIVKRNPAGRQMEQINTFRKMILAV